MSGLLESAAPALLLGLFLAAALPSPWSLVGTLLGGLLMMLGRRLLAPKPGATGLVLGLVLVQIGALGWQSATPSARLETTLFGRFEGRMLRRLSGRPGLPPRALVGSLRRRDDPATSLPDAIAELPPDLLGAPRGLPLECEGFLEPGPGRSRLLGRLREDLDLPAPIARWRRAAAGRLARHVPEGAGPWFAALALGKELDDPERRELLAASGAGHFFVVSGLHVGLLAGLLLRLALRLGWERRRAAPLVAICLVGYALLCGGRPPVLRALLLLLFLFVADRLDRPLRPLRLLLVVAALFLLADPDLLRDPSFSFSFSAVAGILCLAGPRPRDREALARFLARKGHRRWLRGPLGTLRVAEAAFLATAPLALLGRGVCTPASIPGSLLLLPLVGALLVLSALALLGPLPAGPIGVLIGLLERLLAGLSSLPAARIEVGRPPLAFVLLAWATLGLGGWFRQGGQAPWRTRLLIWSGFLVMLAAAWWTSTPALIEARAGSASFRYRAGSRVFEISRRENDGPLTVGESEPGDRRLLWLSSPAGVIALRHDEGGMRRLVLGAAHDRVGGLGWAPVDEIVFGGPCPSWLALDLVREFRPNRYRMLWPLDPELDRLLLAEGLRERPP